MEELTPELVRLLVTAHGSIDRAAPHSGMSTGRFRQACREHGISAVRSTASAPASPIAVDDDARYALVYFIATPGGKAVKIGVAVSPLKRLGDLQTGSPERLTLLGVLPGGVRLEKELHVRFAQHRLLGEWYDGKILKDVASLLTDHVALVQPRRKSR